MSAAENRIALGVGRINLSPSPIYPKWILEGNPIARNKLLYESADGAASSYIWDCTAGRFTWYYEAEETIHVIEGGVVLTEASGVVHRLRAGDSYFFPVGAHVEWDVEDYIRKFALIRTPLPRSLVLAKRAYRFLKRLIGNGGRANASPVMFQNT